MSTNEQSGAGCRDLFHHSAYTVHELWVAIRKNSQGFARKVKVFFMAKTGMRFMYIVMSGLLSNGESMNTLH